MEVPIARPPCQAPGAAAVGPGLSRVTVTRHGPPCPCRGPVAPNLIFTRAGRSRSPRAQPGPGPGLRRGVKPEFQRLSPPIGLGRDSDSDTGPGLVPPVGHSALASLRRRIGRRPWPGAAARAHHEVTKHDMYSRTCLLRRTVVPFSAPGPAAAAGRWHPQ